MHGDPLILIHKRFKDRKEKGSIYDILSKEQGKSPWGFRGKEGHCRMIRRADVQ